MSIKEKKIVFSLGGSLIVPGEAPDIPFLKKFRIFILDLLKDGYKIAIVAGGGRISRKYNMTVQKIVKVGYDDRDWLGIAATKLNAELVRIMFSHYAYPRVLDNPDCLANKSTNKLVVAGGWKPGSSSDKVAVLWAKSFKAGVVVNLTDIDFVYDHDPDKYPEAKPLKSIDWKGFFKIIGKKWTPHKSAPFDPIAGQIAQKAKIKVIIINGKNFKNLKNCLEGKNFKGTVIS